MSDAGLPIRPDLVGVAPYGAPQLDVAVRLNTNENPYPPGPAVQAAIESAVARELPRLDRYPDRDAVKLRAALADYLSSSTGVALGIENVWAANGSNEVLAQLLALFGGAGRCVIGFGPTYSMHSEISRTSGTSYVDVPRTPEFAIDLAAAQTAIEQNDPTVVFVCSPNNPTGTSCELDTLRELYRLTVENSRGVLVVDEAYAEFSSRPSAITLLDGRQRLIVTRTMSKAFGFAGGRVGYLAADPAVVDALQIVRLPYHLSSLTQAAAVAALSHAHELAQAVADLRDQRDRIVAELRALGLAVVPSDANFVLFATPGDQAQLWQELLDAGVLVRDVGRSGWLRVTAGTQSETTAFLDAMKDIIGRSKRTDQELTT